METTKPLDIRPSSPHLWTGILTGPFAFATAFTTKYAMVDWICDHKAEWIFWAITLVALLVCAFGAFESWRGLKNGEDTQTRPLHGHRRPRADRGLRDVDHRHGHPAPLPRSLRVMRLSS